MYLFIGAPFSENCLHQKFCSVSRKANFANNSIHTIPIEIEAVWGPVDLVTGKLVPEKVGSPRTVEVVVRGNPFADAKKKPVNGAPGERLNNAGDENVPVTMDETQ